MTEDEMNPDICSSALDENGNLDRTNGPEWGKHKWNEDGECDECGTSKDEDTKSARTLTIDIDEGEDTIDVLNRVKELIEQGFTSGYYPTWSLTEDEE